MAGQYREQIARALGGMRRANNHDVMGRDLLPPDHPDRYSKGSRMSAREEGYNMFIDDDSSPDDISMAELRGGTHPQLRGVDDEEPEGDEQDMMLGELLENSKFEPATDGEIYENQYLNRLAGRKPYTAGGRFQEDYSSFSGGPDDIPTEMLRRRSGLRR